MSLRDLIIRELKKRQSVGMDQYEIEELMGFSKSTASETLSKLESEGLIVRQETAGRSKRVWLREYFPYRDPGMIRIGCLRSTEYAKFLSVAMDYGEKKGLKISVRFYDEATEILQDLASGTLEFGLAPIFTETLFALSSHEIVIVAPVASGGSGIFENQSAANDLVATSESTSMMLLAREFQKKRRDVKITVFSDPIRARKNFQNGDFRYIAIWEPYASLIGGKMVYDFSELMDSFPCCGIAVSSNRSADKDMNNLLRAYADQNVEIRSDVIDMLSRATRCGKRAVRNSISSYNFQLKYDMQTVVKYMDFIGYPVADDAIKKVFLL
ncbi:MarR family transcriptional regulator [Thermoplasma sp.]|uniref:MarR family transcriptional regulator n=1 Tax=Thermoplasma sp. TaxID=1973142 RepID=UPI001289298F|nr:MarR family transcriptional regulator [Thermoplasma sp.]KAA8923445.1 MAG: hypothetical protein F6Q11_00370 [Thermoplasma sp.]